jgi:lipoprotein NlpI
MSSGHSGGIDKTIGEFSAILAKPEITVEQRAVVSYLRGLASGRVGNAHKAIEDFYAVTLLPDAPEGLRKTVKSHFKENPAVADFF